MNQPEQTRTLLAILARGNGRPWMEELKSFGIGFHLQFSGKGTASSDMMNLLGLDSSDKDLVLSFGAASAVDRLSRRLGESIRGRKSLQGILAILQPSAVNRLMAVMTTEDAQQSAPKEEAISMANSEFSYSLILIAVNRGYTDEVMQAARSAGATGGTAIRARLAETQQIDQRHGITLEGEREILSIIVPDTCRNAVLEAVNREYGLTSPAQSILCSLPTERVYKL